VQEYAISTEELREPLARNWNIARSKASQATTAAKRLPPLHSGDKQKQATIPVDSGLYPCLPRCQICGGFISGAGPGLYYTQQQYTSAQTKRQPLKFIKPEVHQNGKKAQSGEHLQALSESDVPSKWESDLLPCREKLQLRSIYFDQVEEELESFEIKVNKPTSKASLNEFPLERKPEAPSLCAQCSETESLLSFSDDVVHERRSAAQPSLYRRNISANISTSKSSSQEQSKFAMRDFMLLNRAAAVFIYFNGIKPSLRISATAFRNMARRCRIAEQGSMPSIDILFIDIMRQWQSYSFGHLSPFYDTLQTRNHVTRHQPAGLPFQGFLEALFKIASSRFHGETLKEKLEILISNCEMYIREASRAEKAARKKHAQQTRRRVYESPRVSGTSSQRHPY